MDQSKRVSAKKVPLLNLPPRNSQNSHRRRNSHGDNKDFDIKSIERIAEQYRQLDKSINEIKNIDLDSMTHIKDLLSEIKACVLFDNNNIGDEIKIIRDKIHELSTKHSLSPRILSRIDAIVGNTQMTILKFDRFVKEYKSEARLDKNNKELHILIENHNKEIINHLDNVQKQLTLIDQRLNVLNQRFSILDQRVAYIEHCFTP